MNDSQIVEKVINVLMQAPLTSHKDDSINFAHVYLKQVELEGLTHNQWNSGIAILMIGKYLVPSTEEKMEEHLEDINIFEKLFPNAIADFKKLSEEDKKKFEENLKKAEEQMSNPLTPTGQRNIHGEILNSGPIGTYKILKDLRKLKEEIQGGFDVKYILQNISYNKETKTLSFKNMDIEMQPTSKPNMHTKILSFLKHNGLKEQYSFNIIWSSHFFDGYQKEGADENIIDVYLEQLENRIEQVTAKKYGNKISDFLIITEQNKKKYVQINPKYSS